MTIIPSLPNNLTNGTTADATQVMADFNAIVSAVNTNAAASGVNSDISQLVGLSTPLSVGQGGTGLNALTAHYVPVGNGTSAPTLVSPGSAGKVLTSNGTSADPSFQDLGSMAAQQAYNVAIVGGTITGTTIIGHASADLQASNNLSDLASLATALTNLGFSSSANGNGYVKFPTALLGGIIFQWGSISNVSGSGTAVTFPITFPNHVYCVFGQDAKNSQNSFGVLNATSIGLSGFTAFLTSGPNSPFGGDSAYWFAIGN